MAKPKIVKTRVSFKNPDLVYSMKLSERAQQVISDKAEFGEYFTFELSFDADTGECVGARQLNAG